MNRKVHNSLSAFVAAAAFLVLGLAAAVPGVAPPATPMASQASPGAQPLALDAAVTATSQANQVASRGGKSARRHRHRLVMPYFSFSSRS